MDVVKPQQHLLEVESADLLIKSSTVSDIVEQLTALDGFLSDVGDRNGFTILLLQCGLFAELVVLDDVLELEFLRRLNFLLQ